MVDEESQYKRNNFDTNQPTVNYSNSIPTFPRFLDPTMLVNGRASVLNEYRYPLHLFFILPQTSYIIRSSCHFTIVVLAIFICKLFAKVYLKRERFLMKSNLRSYYSLHLSISFLFRAADMI